MTHVRWLAVLFVLAALAAPAAADDAKDELKKFEGSWTVTAAEQNGVAGNRDQLAEMKWVHEGDKLTIKLGTTIKESTISLDPSKSPKTMDMRMTSGPGKEETYHGIYKFLDEELILCFPDDTAKGRPKEFTGKADSGQVLYTLKRKKG